MTGSSKQKLVVSSDQESKVTRHSNLQSEKTAASDIPQPNFHDYPNSEKPATQPEEMMSKSDCSFVDQIPQKSERNLRRTCATWLKNKKSRKNKFKPTKKLHDQFSESVSYKETTSTVDSFTEEVSLKNTVTMRNTDAE